METETWLIGSIGAVAVAVVEPDPREGARAVPASDHLRREVRLIWGNDSVRNRDETRCGGRRLCERLVHLGAKRRRAVVQRRRRRQGGGGGAVEWRERRRRRDDLVVGSTSACS